MHLLESRPNRPGWLGVYGFSHNRCGLLSEHIISFVNHTPFFVCAAIPQVTWQGVENLTRVLEHGARWVGMLRETEGDCLFANDIHIHRHTFQGRPAVLDRCCSSLIGFKDRSRACVGLGFRMKDFSFRGLGATSCVIGVDGVEWFELVGARSEEVEYHPLVARAIYHYGIVLKMRCTSYCCADGL